MKISAYGVTDVGQKRRRNEDYVLVNESLGLNIVCDGVGGGEIGDVMSEKAAEIVMSYIADHQRELAEFKDTIVCRQKILKIVEQAISNANLELFKMARDKASFSKEGTTLTMLLMVGEKAVLGHVGDSRAYLSRGGKLQRLTSDHNFLSELLKQGMPYEDAKENLFANHLTRGIAMRPSVDIDTMIFDIVAGDRMLLCSDGLSRYFEDDVELEGHLDDVPMEGLCDHLIGLANRAGGKDNITALTIFADPTDEVQDTHRQTHIDLQNKTLNNIELFADLNVQERSHVLGKLTLARVKAGQTLIEEGDHNKDLFVILSGSLAVYKHNRLLKTLPAGSTVGEMSLFGTARTATVKAVEETDLLQMKRSCFNELVGGNTRLGVKLLWRISAALARRLDDASS